MTSTANARFVLIMELHPLDPGFVSMIDMPMWHAFPFLLHPFRTHHRTRGHCYPAGWTKRPGQFPWKPADIPNPRTRIPRMIRLRRGHWIVMGGFRSADLRRH
jgi:hypothetical protein